MSVSVAFFDLSGVGYTKHKKEPVQHYRLIQGYILKGI